MADPDELYLDYVGHAEAHRLDQAARTLEQLSSLEPASQRVIVARAQLAELAGDETQAAEILERFTASNLDAGVARANLARLYYKAGERSKAVSTVRFALMRAPNQERSLHFYAALIQEDGGIHGALESLRLLSDLPGAWLPAWVAAQLAGAHGQESRIGEFLLVAAKKSQSPFPPNPESFRELFMTVPTQDRRTLASDLRSYCREETRSFLDLLLSATAPRYRSAGASTAVHRLRRSVWRHLVDPKGDSLVGLGPVSLIKPESWGVAEIAGRLGRGFALLVCEALDAQSEAVGTVFLESDPSRGLITYSGPLPGTLLASYADSSFKHLLSSYLSFREPSEFVLDVEVYNSDGIYTGRESFRAQHPGLCFQALSQKMATLAPPSGPAARPPAPTFNVDDALARDSVATLALCAEKGLAIETIANPAQLLDALVAYAAESATASAMLTLWAGVEAAARAGLEAGLLQRPVVAELLGQDPNLAGWVVR